MLDPTSPLFIVLFVVLAFVVGGGWGAVQAAEGSALGTRFLVVDAI